MSVSATSSTAAASTASTSTTSTSSSFSSEDFLSLLVSQLQNQNPLEPTSTDAVMDQMMSYASYAQQTEIVDALENLSVLATASYGQQTKTTEALAKISEQLEDIADALDVVA